MARVQQHFGVTDENLIKPGIGEATRVLLRRVPERVMLRDRNDPEVSHLLQLAQEKQVPCHQDPSLPYQAIALIQNFSDA
jgi:hypothetical protein